VRPCFPEEILEEYAGVLARPKFAFPADEIAALLTRFRDQGELVVPNAATAISVVDAPPPTPSTPSDRGYSAHSMRATFITTRLENGAQLEDMQKPAGHRDPGTTKRYNRRGYNAEKAASFFDGVFEAMAPASTHDEVALAE
jgi:site-specific recombinase XerD